MQEKQTHIISNNNNLKQGQAMVEFAIVLPVVLMIVFGIIEVGFLLFTYSSVNSAAREAARYGIAIEDVDGGAQRYYDCDGIVEAGLKIGRFAGMTSGDFAIHYDGGPETANIADSCAALASGDPSTITFGDRIVVEVTHQYRPLVAYMGLNIRPFAMSSTSARTIFKGAEIIAGGGDGVYGGGGGGTGECALLNKQVLGGSGQAPAVSPTSSDGCDPDNFVAGEALTLTANPNPGFVTLSWSGVDSVDAGNNNIAYLTFPGATTVGVTYVSDTCYTLGTPTYTGNGNAPSYSPAISAVCATGYAEGETITFT
ncbi:MAG: pilus assembly protein, partial [Anaerolineales bacterium]